MQRLVSKRPTHSHLGLCFLPKVITSASLTSELSPFVTESTEKIPFGSFLRLLNYQTCLPCTPVPISFDKKPRFLFTCCIFFISSSAIILHLSFFFFLFYFFPVIPPEVGIVFLYNSDSQRGWLKSLPPPTHTHPEPSCVR